MAGTRASIHLTDTTLGLALRATRQRRGLSQGKLATTIGLTREQVTLSEGGRRKITAVELYRWAEALGTTPNRLYRSALAVELALAFALLTTPTQTELALQDACEVKL